MSHVTQGERRWLSAIGTFDAGISKITNWKEVYLFSTLEGVFGIYNNKIIEKKHNQMVPLLTLYNIQIT